MGLLLCDLDDTLIDRAGAFRRWLEEFAVDHGIPREQHAWLLAQDGDGVVDRRTFFAALRERFGLRETVEELVATYHEVYPAYVLPPPADVLAAVRRLKADGWRVGVVTNGAASQVAKMTHAGLIDVLDGWCVSDLVGHRKPDPEIFRLAAGRCGASLDGAWMVGDHGPADIAGAVSAGIASVWIRRGREWIETGYGPTHVADSLAEAIDLIAPRG